MLHRTPAEIGPTSSGLASPLTMTEGGNILRVLLRPSHVIGRRGARGLSSFDCKLARLKFKTRKVGGSAHSLESGPAASAKVIFLLLFSKTRPPIHEDWHFEESKAY